MRYDIILISSAEDSVNIRRVVDSLANIQEKPDNVICVCPIDVKDKVDGVIYVLDDNATSVAIPAQKSWIKQQYIKLFQNVTNDVYLVVDCDMVFCKPISIFDNDKIKMFTCRGSRYKTFDRYIDDMFALNADGLVSYVTDFMVFDRAIINEMILSKYGSIEHFISVNNDKVKGGLMMSEYELYGTYVMTYHKDRYVVDRIKKRNVWDSLSGDYDVSSINKKK